MTRKSTSKSRKAAAAVPSFEQLAAQLPDLEGDWEYLLEGLKIDIAEQVLSAMKAANITGVELAERMGVKPPMISRILNHTGNVQLQTLAKLAAALDLDPAIRLIGKEQKLTIVERVRPTPGKGTAEAPSRAKRPSAQPTSRVTAPGSQISLKRSRQRGTAV